jgi:hypothetical protein
VGSKKPFCDYTLPPGVNIGRENGVTLLRGGRRGDEIHFLACIVQLLMWKAITDPSGPLDIVLSQTEESLARDWLSASRQVARIEFIEPTPGWVEWFGESFFDRFIGSIFECEPTTVQTKAAALKVIQRLRAMRGQLRAEDFEDNDFVLLQVALWLLELEKFTAEHQALASDLLKICHVDHWGYHRLGEDLIEMTSRKHLQATKQRAKQNASRNRERDERIRAEYKALRDGGSTVEDSHATLAGKHELSIERIKQIVKASLPKNL